MQRKDKIVILLQRPRRIKVSVASWTKEEKEAKKEKDWLNLKKDTGYQTLQKGTESFVPFFLASLLWGRSSVRKKNGWVEK